MAGIRLSLSLFCLALGIFSPRGVAQPMDSEKANLPETTGNWKLAGPPRRIDAGNIFDYMNGGGELYLAYRFDHMLAWEYREGGGNDITVEVYRMQASDDAFGLLSLDWGGEGMSWGSAAEKPPADSVAPTVRALYGAGLLRLWAGNLYARIMAVRETPEARAAILELGRIIAADRPLPPPPALLGLLPAAADGAWRILPDRTAFFRSHLVLNSFYYVSHENILGLGPDCEAVFATYERGERRGHLLIVCYRDSEAASRGLEGFLKSYVPEKGERKNYFQVEDGWLGCRLAGSRLVLAFACPDRESAQGLVGRVVLDR